MTKLIDFQNNLSQLPLLGKQEQLSEYYAAFETSELGRMYKAIPWGQILKVFSRKLRNKVKGPRPLFDLKGKVALMILKSYCTCSDSDLIDRLNSDWKLQLFCGVYLGPNDAILNFKIVSSIRCELSAALKDNYGIFQEVLAKAWKPYLEHPHIAHMDATAYESAIRYPTDVKLLWESCDWIHKKIRWWSSLTHKRCPRSKFKEQKKNYLNYQRSRRKTHAMTKRRKNSLLYLLNKLLHQHDDILMKQGISIHNLPAIYAKRLRSILEVYLQQERMTVYGETSIKNRIVSIDKPYLHPIVRGKENKPVEFGAKVHMVQIGGINFMEHISFEAYNESTRLINSIYLIRKYTGKCTHIGADSIYATNKNRSYCSKENIQTSFVRKGKAGPNEPHRSQMQKILAKDRSTRMEGSFGTEKNHYGLKRVLARTLNTETLWIFFGIHTANLCRIIHKIPKNIILKQAA